MDKQNRCCGNCKHFKDEDVSGFGICSKDGVVTKCDTDCSDYSDKHNGWTEITPDNVDELYEIKEDLLIIAFKLGDKIYYQHKPLMRATLNTLAKYGGYYFYVLPELKIELYGQADKQED